MQLHSRKELPAQLKSYDSPWLPGLGVGLCIFQLLTGNLIQLTEIPSRLIVVLLSRVVVYYIMKVHLVQL